MKHLKSLHQVNSNKKLIKVFKVVTSLFLLALLFGFGYYGLLTVFKLTVVEINGKSSYLNLTDFRTIVEAQVLHKSILSLNTSKLSNTLLSNFRYIKSLEIKKELPNKLIVTFEERVPSIVYSSAGENYLVDADGFVLGVSSPSETQYSILAGTSGLKVGEFTDSFNHAYLSRLQKALDEKGIEVRKVAQQPDTFLLELKDGLQIYFSLKKNPESSVSILSEVLAEYRLKNSILKKVDLRYDNVVVEY